MAFMRADYWVWDFWIARDGATYHLFFLQAPRSLGEPELRHWHATVGHAVSTDLVNWDYVGTCFGPASGPAWDDGTTWTGSILRHDGHWHFFYTGTSWADDRKKQRIGHAVSDDLHEWRRLGDRPVLDLDPHLYEEYSPEHWHDRSLRDPWVAPDPGGSGFRMWFTARVRDGAADGRGVIGTAHSRDLESWTIEPPVTPHGDFGEVEVPEFWQHGGRRYLLFCSTARRTSAARRDRLAADGMAPDSGTHYYIANGADAAWRLGRWPFLSGTANGSLYAGRIVDGPGGDPLFLGTVGHLPDGTYAGMLSDPHPVLVGADGTLSLGPPLCG